VEEKDGQELDDEALLERLRGHLHRGVAQLSVRARSPLEIAQLVAHASAA
jgi:DNA sulfur modification protein DndE